MNTQTNLDFYQTPYQMSCPFGCGLLLYSNLVEQHTRVCTRNNSIKLVSGGKDHALRIWDSQITSHLGDMVGHTGDVTSIIQVSQRVIASAGNDKKILIWDIDGILLKTLHGHTEYVDTLARIDANTIASGSRDDTIRIWNISTGECTKIIKQRYDINTLLFHHESNYLISGTDDKIVRCFDVKTGNCVKELKGHDFGITALAPLGHISGHCRVVSGSADRTIKIWDITTGKCLFTLEGHTDLITGLICLGHNTFASCGDTTICVWDSLTGMCIRKLQGHTGKITSMCATSPDTIVSSSEDGTMRIWSVGQESILRIIEGITETVRAVAVIQ